MTPKILDDTVIRLREAAIADDQAKAVRDVLETTLLDSDAMAKAVASMVDDEVMLFEDDTCSIWTCRFDNDIVLPPHEHRMAVHIAVYQGAELELLYQRDSDRLVHTRNELVSAGNVVNLDSDAIHAVTAEGSTQSHAIHVYEGPLMQIKRSLFDWDTGKAVEFTMENLHAMARKKSEMEDIL